MHSKKDTLPLLPFLAPRAIKKPSLSPSCVPDEPGEEAQPPFEASSHNAQENGLSEDELELWNDEIESLETAEDDEALEV